MFISSFDLEVKAKTQYLFFSSESIQNTTLLNSHLKKKSNYFSELMTTPIVFHHAKPYLFVSVQSIFHINTEFLGIFN